MNRDILKAESVRLIESLRNTYWPRLVVWLEDRSPRRLFLKALLAGLLVSVPWQCSRVIYDAYFAEEDGQISVATGTLPGPDTLNGSITGMPGPKAPRAEEPAPDTIQMESTGADTVAVAPADTDALPVAVDHEAAVLRRVAPEYPVNALRDGRSGTVVLKVRIDAEGNPGEIDIEKSSGTRALDRAARDAVRQWRFSPKIVGGMAVDGELSVPVDFKLEP